jgi:hypothetical protein
VAKPRLLVIQPTYYRNDSIQNGDNGSGSKLYKTRSRSLVGLTLPYLAALTPKEWDVQLVDEQIEDVDFRADVDLVAITTRFYIGEQYRCRPPEEVVEEIRAIGARKVFFADSMFAGKRSRAMELMEALIPLRIRWSTLGRPTSAATKSSWTSRRAAAFGSARRRRISRRGC